jgi:hypothetical protein
MRTEELHLSDAQEKLYNKLCGGGDVRISVLFRTVKGRWPAPTETQRHQQQLLGSYIVHINKKLRVKGWIISPGVARGTYRLSRIQK